MLEVVRDGAGTQDSGRGPSGSPRPGVPAALAEGDGQHTLFSLPFGISLSETARCLWIGSSTGLLIFNLSSFELEAVLHYKGKIYLQRIFDTDSMKLERFPLSDIRGVTVGARH